MVELFLWILLAHIVADFVLQTPAIAEAKCAGYLRGYIKHAAWHFFALMVFTHQYVSLSMFGLWLALPLVHTLTDWAKNRLIPPRHPADAPAFVVDQALHLLVAFSAPIPRKTRERP